MHTDTALLQSITTRLQESFDPEKIVLFGSHVEGRARSDSDIDILVVLRDSKESRVVRTQRAYRSLRGLTAPTELFVYTEKEMSNPVNRFAAQALVNGYSLYERGSG